MESLKNLGFTPTEAEAYVFLLGEPPASGYRVAQALGRPAAQVYRALEQLRRKGAIVTTSDKPKLCRAVPVEECLANLGREFLSRQDQAKAELGTLPSPPADDGVYQLESAAHVIGRCEAMMAQASDIAIVDMSPEPFALLRPAVERMIRRGVTVALNLYQPAEMPGAALQIVADDAEETLGRWPGQVVNFAVDGREFLTGTLTRDGLGLKVGFWSQNTLLAAVVFNGMSCEVRIRALRSAVLDGRSSEDLRELIERTEALRLTRSPALSGLKSVVREADE